MRIVDRSTIRRQILTLASRHFGIRNDSTNVAKSRKVKTVDFTVKFNPFSKTGNSSKPGSTPRKSGPVLRRATEASIKDVKKSEGSMLNRKEETAAAAAAAEVNPASIIHEPYIPPFLEGMEMRRLYASNIHVRTSVKRVRIKFVKYVKSSATLSECPEEDFPEIAVIGRSNVGKSSLINVLLEKTKMALVSKKPGRTQLIDHFRVNDSWYLVDLPGYGVARAPNEVCKKWGELVKDYFLHRKTLAMVILLVDVSIGIKEIDLDCAKWLVQNNVPMTIAFTKCDKGTMGKSCRNAAKFLQKLRETYPYTAAWIMTSCVTKQGGEDLSLYLSEIRNYWRS